MDPPGNDHNAPTQDFPNPIVEGCHAAIPSRPWVLVLLVLLCAAPRVWEARHWDILWVDTILYLQASDAIEQDNIEQALDQFGLNIFPVILTGLRRLGPDWETTGKYWSVLMATLTVLPLWGWIRRQFNDRIALAACLCYCFHGKLVAVSPLIIRDPTFWLLFVSTLYWMWRAIVEIRFRLFLTAGIMLTLAIHTRTEGWLLVVPLIGWMAGRMSAATGSRARLAAGGALCLAVIPLSVATVNLTVLRDHPRWEILRTQHATIVWDWWRTGGALVPGQVTRPHETVPDPDGPAGAADRPATSNRHERFVLDRKLAIRLVKGFTCVGGLLALVGLCNGWRLLFRRDHLALLLMNMLLLATIRIRYSQAGIDIRYFLPTVLVALPWMALGFFQIAAWVVWLSGQKGSGTFCAKHPKGRSGKRCLTPFVRRTMLVCGLAVLAAVCSLAEKDLAAARMMRRQSDLGHWILDHLGPQQSISGNDRLLLLAAYYARGRLVATFDLDAPDENLPSAIETREADVVLLWPSETYHRERNAWAEAQIGTRLGYRRVPADQLPSNCRELLLFVRGDKTW